MGQSYTETVKAKVSPIQVSTPYFPPTRAPERARAIVVEEREMCSNLFGSQEGGIKHLSEADFLILSLEKEALFVLVGGLNLMRFDRPRLKSGRER